MTTRRIQINGQQIDVCTDEGGGRIYPVKEWDRIWSSMGTPEYAEALNDVLVQLVSENGPELWPSLGEYPVYDDFVYFIMTSDEGRNRRYRRAVKRYAPGRTVVDIGTGRDLNWARACIDAGATSVFAIEMGQSFAQAERSVAELGLGDRITLIPGRSTEVRIPERVDLCVSEIIGMIGGAEGAGVALRDAGQRFLKLDGIMIPHRCVTNIAAVTLPDDLATRPSMSPIGLVYLEKIFNAVGRPFDIRICARNLPPESIISGAAVFESLGFNGDIRAEQQTEIRLDINRAGRLDGFLLWIHLWCDDGDDYIDAFAEQSNWLPVFFPVFEPGIPVKPGDTVEAVSEACLSDDGIHPDYHISGTVAAGGAAHRFQYISPHHSGGFRENAFTKKLFS